jgi:hypothetical protein
VTRNAAARQEARISNRPSNPQPYSSTCPPRTAVRQSRMSRKAFFCGGGSTDPHTAKKSASCVRKTSANSSRCWFIVLAEWSGQHGPGRAGPTVPEDWW